MSERSHDARLSAQTGSRPPKTPKDLSLEDVQVALAGDVKAMARLVATLTPVIQARAARVLCRSGATSRDAVRQEVEDLVQSIFVSLFADDGKALRRWDPEKGSNLRSFVALVAEREAVSILRTRKRNPFTEAPTEAEALERAQPASDAHRAWLNRNLMDEVVRRMRGALSEQGYEIFELLFCRERNADSIAELLGLTMDAIYAWRSRIRKTAQAIAADVHEEVLAGGAP